MLKAQSQCQALKLPKTLIPTKLNSTTLLATVERSLTEFIWTLLVKITLSSQDVQLSFVIFKTLTINISWPPMMTRSPASQFQTTEKWLLRDNVERTPILLFGISLQRSPFTDLVNMITKLSFLNSQLTTDFFFHAETNLTEKCSFGILKTVILFQACNLCLKFYSKSPNAVHGEDLSRMSSLELPVITNLPSVEAANLLSGNSTPDLANVPMI